MISYKILDIYPDTGLSNLQPRNLPLLTLWLASVTKALVWKNCAAQWLFPIMTTLNLHFGALNRPAELGEGSNVAPTLKKFSMMDNLENVQNRADFQEANLKK